MKGMQAAVDLIVSALGNDLADVDPWRLRCRRYHRYNRATAFAEVGIRTAFVIPNRLDER